MALRPAYGHREEPAVGALIDAALFAGKSGRTGSHDSRAQRQHENQRQRPRKSNSSARHSFDCISPGGSFDLYWLAQDHGRTLCVKESAPLSLRSYF